MRKLIAAMNMTLDGFCDHTQGPGRIYVVEPTGAFIDDPNVTDKKFPGNPTKSYRSGEPLRVVGEYLDWQGHSRRRSRQ